MRAPLTARGRLALGVACFALVASTTLTPAAQESPVLAAMTDELARSMKELRLKDQPAPYYIEYEVWDRALTSVSARLGAAVNDSSSKERTLRVNVRVGDYDFDSSLFNAPGVGGGGVVTLESDGTIGAPLDDDYDAMRRQIWLATDAAYKRAVSVFARKKAAFQNRGAGGDVVPDFSRETPLQTVKAGHPLQFVNRDWPERTRQISAVFTTMPFIEGSDVSVADTRGTRYFLNSEGFKVVAPLEMASLRVTAEAKADDGTVVRDLFTIVERQLKDMPPVTELTARARAMGERLQALRSAPIAEEFAGPILLEGQASAELVSQVLLPPLLARRAAESAGRGRSGPPPTTPFLRRIGLRVLTDPFSVTATPSLTQFEGRPVAGSYEVDDYGIKARDVSPVEKGRLVSLLTGRTPLKGFLTSSGHTRGGDVWPSVIQIQSAEAIPAAEVRAKYLALLKTQDREFGYIIRALADGGGGGGGGGGPVVLQGVKVTRDGKEQPVRGLRLAGATAASFRDLMDASRERTMHNFRATSVDAVSVIVPNLIFEELEIQQTREITQKPPVVKSPLMD